MSHTKGPWIYERGTTFLAVHTADRRKTVHFNSSPENGTVEAEANARIIAAAPDILAMLQELSTWLVSPDCSPETIEHIKSRIDAEIQHATGREV